MNNNRKGLLLATTTAVLWGFLAVALKVALTYFDSYTIVWSRFAIAFIVMVIYYLFKHPKRLVIIIKPPKLLILGSIFLGINYLGFMQGIHYAGPGITQVFIQSGPVVLGLIGFVFFKEKLTWIRASGFFLAGLGFIFFYNQQLIALIEEAEIINKGILFVLMGATAWTGYAVCNKLLVRTKNPLDLNLLFYGIPTIGYIYFADFSLFNQVYPWWVWLLLLFLGLNTVLAYGALSSALKYTESNKVSIILTVNPVITFIILESMFYFNISWFKVDSFSAMAYVGTVLVLIGAILAIGIFKRR